MWYTHWQCQFQSMNGTQYAVNICKQTARVGDIVQLTGAAEPFTTQEDDSDDIFTPIRIQTGYLRVIDPDGSLLADLIPANNTERLVQLWSGTNTDGRFTPSLLHWQGFLQAQAYTQPWDGNVSELELPVKSLLGAFEDVTIDESNSSALKNVAALIVDAFDQFGLRDDNDLKFLSISSDVSDAMNVLMKPLLQMAVFFDEETVVNEGDSYQQLVGVTYYDAVAAIMSLYGLQLRENAGTIYMSQYDGDNVVRQSLGWSYLRSLASGSSVAVTPSDIASVDMLQTLNFKGADNVAGYIQGGRCVKVVLDFSRPDATMIAIPMTTEDNSEVVTIQDVYNGVVKVQPHTPRSNQLEEFTYLYYDSLGYGPTDSTYANCVAGSVIRRRWSGLVDNSRTTGAFPVRWSFRAKNDGKAQTLINGIMFNAAEVGYGQALPDKARACYKIQSALEHNSYNGFLHLSLDISCFFDLVYCAQIMQWGFGTYDMNYGQFMCCFYLKVAWGDKYWNGTEWTTTESTFMIETDGNTINSNIEQYKGLTDLSDGYIIPITEEMSGTIQVTLMNFAAAKCVSTDAVSRCPFISGIIRTLSVEYVPLFYPTESSRNNNIYRRVIISSGFSEEKEIGLTVGTYNNNYDSMAFIKNTPTTYIESMNYLTAPSTTKQQRPELHLLDRMMSQFGEVRRLFNATVQRGLDVMSVRYTYLNRRFFGVKAQTNWREDTEKIKFIEVS